MRLGGQRHAPAALPPGKTRCTLYRRLGGPQDRSGQLRNISPSPEFDARTVQPVSRCAIPAHHFSRIKVKVKLKEPRNRPGVTQRVPEGLGSQIPWHSALEGGEVISLTYRPPLPQGHGTVGRNISLKNPVTPPGVDPGTVRLVALQLTHHATPGP
jgi:hypothetical protein